MSIREQAKRAVVAAGLGGPARRLTPAFLLPASSRQNRRDDDRIRLLIALSLRADDSCIDIGSNYGGILEQMVAACPEGRHLAFEPVPALAAALEARFPGVEVRREALSDRAGEAVFTVNESTPGLSGLSSSLRPDNGGITREVVVQVARLDDVLPEGFRPALIKIDVEGHELEVLRGARHTLREHRPTVVFEHGHGGAAPRVDATRALFEELEGAGLRLFDLEGLPLPWPAFQHAYLSGDRWNFVAHP